MRHALTIIAASVLAFATAADSVAQVATNYVRMGVVLPLKEKSPRGAKMVEFYQGMLMAVDSVRHQGCSVDIVALHSGSTAAQMDSLLADNPFMGCNIVFGPLDAAQLPALADYCNLRGIRLVVPFTSLTAHVSGHPGYFHINSPRSTVQTEAVWLTMNLLNDANILIVETGESNDEGAAMAERLRKAKEEVGVELRTVRIDASDDELTELLNPYTRNVLLPNSATLSALNALRERLRSFADAHSSYALSMLGYPAWQSYAPQMQSDFFRFDTYVFTPFYRNANDASLQRFEQRFEQNFRWPMQHTFPRYGLMGFDIGYFFLRGLAKYGSNFEYNLAGNVTQPMQNPLRFEQASDADGYVNTFVQMVHYTNHQAIEILYRNE